MAAGARAGTAYIAIEPDLDALKRRIARELGPMAKRGGRDFSAGLERGIDTRRVDRALIGTRRNTEGLHGSLLRLKIVAGALALGPAASGLNALSAGAVAATSSLGPLIGSLATVPSVASAAAQALATVKLGTAGVGDALKAATRVQVGASGDAVAALDRQRAAAERVRTAKESLTSAQRQAEQAQRSLTNARREARRELEDMRLGADQAATAQKRAVETLRDAQSELGRVEVDPDATASQIRDAQIRVEEARNDLEATRVEARRARKDYRDANKAGVEKMPQVVSAAEAVEEADRARTSAQRDLTVAIEESTEALGKQSAAASAYDEALAQLSPRARQFVKTLLTYRPALKDLQATSAEGLFPGVERGLASAIKNLPVVRRMVAGTSRELGRIAERTGGFLGRSDVGRDLEIQARRNDRTVRHFGDSSLYLADALRHVTIAAGPLTDWLGESAEGWAKNAAEQARAGRENGTTREYFERTRKILERLSSITGHLTSGIKAVFRAGRDDGDAMWAAIDRGSARFDRWANSLRGQNALREWFREGRETLRDIDAAVDDFIGRVRELRSEGRSSFDAFAIAASEAAARGLSRAVEIVAQRSPAMAEAFIRGFATADVWGRLAIGAFLLKKMGGLGAFRALGGRTGAAYGTSFAASAGASSAAGVRGGAFAGRFGGAVKGAMPGIALAAGALFGPDLIKAIDNAAKVELDANGLPKVERGFFDSARDLASRAQAEGPLGIPVVSPFKLLGELEGEGDLRNFLQGTKNTFDELQALGARDPSKHLADGYLKMAAAARVLARDNPQAADSLNKLAGALEQTGRRRAAVESIQRSIETFASSGAVSIKNLRSNFELNMGRIEESLGLNTKAGAQAAERNIGAAIDVIKRGMSDGTISTRAGMKEIRRLMRTETGASKDAVATNYRKIIGTIERSMKSGTRTTASGLAEIKELMLKELALYGVPRRDALVHVERVRQGSDARGLQTGGTLVPGTGTGDKVPLTIGGRLAALVEPREKVFVLNRNATQELDGLQRFNAAVPRFQHGGVVGYQPGGFVRVPGDPNLTGGRDLVNRSVSNLAAMLVRLFKAEIGYGYDPGGGHRSPGHNVTGTAVDIVPGPGGSWELIDKAVGWATSRGMTVYYDGSHGSTNLPPHGPGHHAHIELATGNPGAIEEMLAEIPGIRVRGEDSPVKTIVQKGLDRVRDAAQSRLEAVAGMAMPEGAEGFSGGQATGNGADLMRQISQQRGWNFADWWELDRRETSHGQNLTNPTSTARLRGQFLDMNWGKYGPGSDPRQNPTMAQQIESMAAYIAERYGNPTRAREHHDSHNWYQRGGLVETLRLQAGGLVQRLLGGGMAEKDGGGTMRPRGMSVALGGRLSGAVETLLHGRRPKNRRRALNTLLDKVKDVGLPADVAGDLERLAGDSEVFGDFADRAAQLTDSGAITEALEAEFTRRRGLGQQFPDADQQAVVEGMLGRVGGLSEPDWLGKQLEALFQWRNRIVQAEQIVVQKRDEMTRLIEQAQDRLKAISDAFRKAAAERTRLHRSLATVKERLERARAASRPNRGLIRRLRDRALDLSGQIRGIDGEQQGRARGRDALKDQIIPAFDAKRTELNDARGELLSNLQNVQGPGSPMELLGVLPPVGVIGGQIFGVQKRLQDILSKPLRVTDSQAGGTDAATEERNRLLEELLREANQRTRVSEEHFKVLRDMPPYGGSFDTGGVVPGPTGAPRTIIAHGGETVLTPEQSGGSVPEVHLHIAQGMEWLRQFVRVEVKDVTRGQARAGARLLPGRGGGVLG